MAEYGGSTRSAGGFPWRAGGERAGRLSLGHRHPEVQVAVSCYQIVGKLILKPACSKWGSQMSS